MNRTLFHMCGKCHRDSTKSNNQGSGADGRDTSSRKTADEPSDTNAIISFIGAMTNTSADPRKPPVQPVTPMGTLRTSREGPSAQSLVDQPRPVQPALLPIPYRPSLVLLPRLQSPTPQRSHQMQKAARPFVNIRQRWDAAHPKTAAKRARACSTFPSVPSKWANSWSAPPNSPRITSNATSRVFPLSKTDFVTPSKPHLSNVPLLLYHKRQFVLFVGFL